MKITGRVLGICLAAVVALTACDDASEKTEDKAGSSAATADVHPALKAHSQLFAKKIHNPVPGVYVAVGYGLANSIMLEGDDGIVIVDTLEGARQAREVLAEFRKITDKPVKAIIFTHNHTDHIYGSKVFAEGREVPVYAHRTTGALIDKIVNILVDTVFARSMRMFGPLLSDDEVVNAGIGPGLGVKVADVALLRPTHVFDDQLDLDVAGLKLKLVHAPGETDDQLFVWLEDRKILLPGDNIYQSFPNLYTIRGTAHRDILKWAQSLDVMRDLKPEAIVPSHTLPLVGSEKVADVLTAYRDAIQYIHDQTVRGINQGLTPDQLVDFVRLPKHLADHPWLIEHYGTVAWSVRAVFNGYIGWFSGQGDELEPLAPTDRAKRMAAAFAKASPLADQARAALAAGDQQWAAELARLWLQAEPDSDEAKTFLARTFKARARGHINPNARHWYLTQAKELTGDLEVGKPVPSDIPDDFLASLPIDGFMAGMTTRLRAEDTLETNTVVRFVFGDVGRTFTVHIRRGVAALSEKAVANPDVTIRTTAEAWKRIAARKRNPALAFAAGEVEVDGGIIEVVKFLALFER